MKPSPIGSGRNTIDPQSVWPTVRRGPTLVAGMAVGVRGGMRASEHQSAFMKEVSKTCSLRCHSTSLALMCFGNSTHPGTGKHLLILVSVWTMILCPPDPFTFHQIHWFPLPPFFSILTELDQACSTMHKSYSLLN